MPHKALKIYILGYPKALNPRIPRAFPLTLIIYNILIKGFSDSRPSRIYWELTYVLTNQYYYLTLKKFIITNP